MDSNDTDSTDCMEMPQDSQSWSILFEGVFSVIVGLCGLLGNAATISGHFTREKGKGFYLTKVYSRILGSQARSRNHPFLVLPLIRSPNKDCV